MIFGFLTKRKREREEAERKAREAEEEKQREEEAAKKRTENSRKIRADLQAARVARAAQEAAEVEACQTIGLTRASTDTQVRKMTATSEEISGVLKPQNGKSVAEMALEAYEAEKAAEAAKKEGSSV